MIHLHQVTLRRGRCLLLESADLRVAPGQRLGLVGINGSGKSSLFALIRGALEADAGDVRVDRRLRIAHVAQESPSTPRPAIDYVIDGDEELRATLDAMSALEHAGDTAGLQPLLESMELIDGFTARARAARLMYGLGFAAGDEDRPVREFSGGWRMRLNLAQALMCRSDILLLDEPTNHLDLPAILWLEHWLKRYQGALALISHDRDFLDALCTHIAHIENRALMSYTGNYSRFEQLRAERLALQQSLYERQQKEIKHIQRYVDRFRYKASKARQAQSRLKMLDRMARIAPAHVDSGFRFTFRDPERQPQQLLSLDQVRAGYDEPVLSEVRMTVNAGDRIGLLGVNGAGKSTLVKALADGSTVLSGERLLHQHARVGYFAQHQLDLLDGGNSAYAHILDVEPEMKSQEVRDFLGRFGFSGERVEEPVTPFSGGEKARLVLALLVLRRPNLLLLDEPTNHLDLEMRQALSMALMEYAGALVVISHDRHLLRSVCEDLFIVHDGRVEHFEDDLDHYPAWLREREEAVKSRSHNAAKPGSSNRRVRQRRAHRRRLLKPHLDRVSKLEHRMQGLRVEQAKLEQRLTDQSMYENPERADELAELSRQVGEIRKELEDLEWAWFQASEALERAEGELDAG